MFLLSGLSSLPGGHAGLVDNCKADLDRTARSWLHVLIIGGFKNSSWLGSLHPSLFNRKHRKNKGMTQPNLEKVRCVLIVLIWDTRVQLTVFLYN